jgi:hypothetical protein
MALRESGKRTSNKNNWTVNPKTGKSHGSSYWKIGKRITMPSTKKN